MLSNNKFIPKLFLQKFTLNYLNFINYNSFTLQSAINPCITFTIDEQLSNSFIIKNEHGNKVVFANEIEQIADAHIIVGTKEEVSHLLQRYLAIKTADCLPIIFVYEDEKYFLGGVTHAGWRGFTSHIISNTFEKLKKEAIKLTIKEDAFLENLKIFIGPAIFGVSYECGLDVKLALEKHKKFIFNSNENLEDFQELFDICVDVKNDSVLVKQVEYYAKQYNRVLQPHSIFPDLQLLAVFECVNLGIYQNNIFIFRENTYGHNEIPSFRELSHKGTGNVKRRLWTYLVLPYCR